MDLIRIRDSINNWEKKLNKFIEIENEYDTDYYLKDNDQDVIIKYVYKHNPIRFTGDKPITLAAPIGVEPATTLGVMTDNRNILTTLQKRDDITFMIDRRPFSKDNSIWKLAFLQGVFGNVVVLYYVRQGTFDYMYCASNDTLDIDDPSCQNILDLAVKNYIEQFCKENLILNLSPQYKRFMYKVMTGEINLLDDDNTNNKINEGE